MSRITEVEDTRKHGLEDARTEARTEAREEAQEEARGEARDHARLHVRQQEEASRLERAWTASCKQIRRWARASANGRFLV